MGKNKRKENQMYSAKPMSSVPYPLYNPSRIHEPRLLTVANVLWHFALLRADACRRHHVSAPPPITVLSTPSVRHKTHVILVQPWIFRCYLIIIPCFPVFPAYAARYPCLPTSHTVLRSSFPCSPTISAHGMNGAVYLVCASAPTTVCFRITSQATTHYQGFQQYGAGRLLQLLQLVGPMLPLLWPQ